jgi:hypothetical protein
MKSLVLPALQPEDQTMLKKTTPTNAEGQAGFRQRTASLARTAATKRRRRTRRSTIPTTTKPTGELSEIELNRIVPLSEAAHLMSLSEDSIKRHFRHLLIQVSTRRLGMRVKHALRIEGVAE